MNDRADFALVPRPPSAIEKAEPGARRILAGIVADTLALAKKNASLDTRQKILLVDDDPDLLDMYREILAELPSRPEVQTANSVPRALAMLEGEPFQLLITGLKFPKMNGFDLLAIVRRKYPELRSAVLTVNTDEQFRLRAYALGVDLFCNKPCTEEETKVWLEQVKSLLARESGGHTLTAQPRKTRPLRIVVLDDEQTQTEAMKLVLSWEYDDAEILTFTDAEEALQELTRKDPDLFTTDFQHPGKKADELLQILAKRKVKYPVFVISAYAEILEVNGFLMGFLDQGLNVSLVSKPFTIKELRALLLKHLGPSDGLKLRKGAP